MKRLTFTCTKKDYVALHKEEFYAPKFLLKYFSSRFFMYVYNQLVTALYWAFFSHAVGFW